MISFLSKTKPAVLKGIALLRLDFNTKDSWRMEASIPTLEYLLRCGGRVVILSHRGRPEHVMLENGVPSGFDPSLSLARDARYLSKALKRRVSFIPHFRFPDIKKEVDDSPRGSVFLLENLRFMKGEEINDPVFAMELANLADYFVNDAFAVSHRANASIAAVPKLLPSYAGLELEKEMDYLAKVMNDIKHPLVIVIGGAKAKDKLGVLKYFKDKADRFLLGGAPANTLLMLSGADIGKSIADDDDDLVELKKVLKYKNLQLPLDFKTKGDIILDIGPKTEKLFADIIKKAKMVVWSGPMGYAEETPFDQGTLAVAKAIAANRKALSVAGGGETVAFLKKDNLVGKFSFISTGGGAMIEFLEGKKLPGIEALKK
jgi:3-phosphoglycerate kinase